MKKNFYIFLLFLGFHFNSTAQVKTTFIGNEEAKVVKFYPNPAVSVINFEFKRDYDRSYNLLIFNFIGKKIIELKASEQKVSVPLNGIYRGVYIFQVRDAQGNIVESGKFQVAN